MQEEINILIIEDEPIWVRAITDSLDYLGYSVAGTAGNFENAISLLNTAVYDLVLLDINLGTRNSGLELGSMVNKLYKKPFIFITGNADALTIHQAIGSNPSAYLIKPVKTETLAAAIQNAINNFNHGNAAPLKTPPETEQGFFFIKQGSKYKKLEWKNILSLRSEKNYTMLFCAEDLTEYPIRSTLSRTLRFTVPRQLQRNFVQVNRSEAVQLSFIREIRNEEVRTTHGTFTITEGYLPGMRAAMQVVV